MDELVAEVGHRNLGLGTRAGEVALLPAQRASVAEKLEHELAVESLQSYSFEYAEVVEAGKVEEVHEEGYDALVVGHCLKCG